MTTLPSEVEPAAPGESSSDLERLVRWIAAGGEWQSVSCEREVTVALLTCDRGEEMERIVSADPHFVAFVAAQETASPPD